MIHQCLFLYHDEGYVIYVSGNVNEVSFKKLVTIALFANAIIAVAMAF